MDRHTSTRTWRRLASTAAIAFAAVTLPAGAAFAAEYPDGGSTSSSSLSDPGTSDPGTQVEVAGTTQTRGELPFTGGDIAALAAVGVSAVGIGGALMVRTRRRHARLVD